MVLDVAFIVRSSSQPHEVSISPMRLSEKSITCPGSHSPRWPSSDPNVNLSDSNTHAVSLGWASMVLFSIIITRGWHIEWLFKERRETEQLKIDGGWGDVAVPGRLIKSRYLIKFSLKHRMAAVIKSMRRVECTGS